MRSVSISLAALVVMTALAMAQDVSAEAALCESKPTGSVKLLILPNQQKVHAYAATLAHIPVVARDPSTVVFQDGRVVTADVDKAGGHLNKLGWASLRLEVVASFGIRPQRRRSFG
jgi:hypothetical protein